jgi:hypothetical protein
MTDKVLISLIRNIDPNVIAADICSVQPMPSDGIKALFVQAKSEKELIEEGYEPVCETTRMIWKKKDTE